MLKSELERRPYVVIKCWCEAESWVQSFYNVLGLPGAYSRVNRRPQDKSLIFSAEHELENWKDEEEEKNDDVDRESCSESSERESWLGTLLHCTCSISACCKLMQQASPKSSTAAARWRIYQLFVGGFIQLGFSQFFSAAAPGVCVCGKFGFVLPPESPRRHFLV